MFRNLFGTIDKSFKLRREEIVLSLIILPSLLLGYLWIKDTSFFVDEYGYFKIIEAIRNLEITSEAFVKNAQLPGYLITVAIITKTLGLSALQEVRLINTLFSLLTIFVFGQIAKKLDCQTTFRKTLQFFFFPLIFVFYFLVYTDVFALLLLLLCFYYLLNNRYYISGVFGLLSVLARQNNIIWLGFFLVYLLFEKYKLQFNKTTTLAFLKDVWVFLLSFLFIALFILINKTPSLGDQAQHPIAIHSENVFLLLFLFFFIFLPLNLYNLPRTIRSIVAKPVIILAILGTFVIYFITFRVDNWYNNPTFTYFIRNNIVNFAIKSPINKILFFLPVSLSIISLTQIPLKRKTFYFLYPFTVIFLSLSWLIEPRYYIIPFALFILFKKIAPPPIENLTVFLFLILACLLMYLTINRILFL